LLGLTNANNNTGEGVFKQLENYAGKLLENINEGLYDNYTTTTNGSSNTTVTSIFHKPKNMSDVRMILMAFLRFLTQIFIIVSY
jgi:hypothetical protein